MASELGFFAEFSSKKLGIVTKRDPCAFEKVFEQMDKQYEIFKSNVQEFRKNLSWGSMAGQHISIYNSILVGKSSKSPLAETIHKTENLK